MPVEQKRLTVVGAQRFVDALAVQEPVIEDRDDRVFLVEHAPVDVNGRGHEIEGTTGDQR